MSTSQVARDSKTHIGSSTDSLLVSTPATLYYENDFSFNPVSCTPSTGAIQRVDLYNTASVRGNLTNIDLVFDLDLGTPTGGVALVSLVKCFEYMKIFIDNVELQWDSGTNISFLNYTRNLSLDSLDKGDYSNKWGEQGGSFDRPSDGWAQGFQAWRQSIIRGSSVDTRRVRTTIPLNMLTSFLFEKWDTRLAQKISVEIKYRNSSNTLQDQEYAIDIVNPANVAYPNIRIVNAFAQQRMMLYTSPMMFKSISEPYMRPLIKCEKQIFKLPAAFDLASAGVYTPVNPMKVSMRLADAFSIHKRILGLTFALVPNYSTAVATGAYAGIMWVPNSCGALVNKGGKLVENLSDPNKFSRQSNHFQKCLGGHWVPRTYAAEDCSGANVVTTTDPEQGILVNDVPLHHGIGGSTLSFLDRNLASTNAAANGAHAKVDLIGGISNSVEEAWEIDVLLSYPAAIRNTLADFPEFTDTLEVYMWYCELASIQANPSGGPSSIKIFS